MANAAQIVSTWIGEYFADTFIVPVVGENSNFDFRAFDVDPAVNKERIDYNVSELKHVTRKKSTCGFSANGQMDLSERTLEVESFAINLEQCYSEFYNTVFRSKLKRGTDIYNLEGTFIQELFEEMTPITIGKDLYKHGWFGNTSSFAATSFLGDMNGWFKLFEDDSNVSKISLATTTGGDLATNAVIDALRSMWTSNLKLRGRKSQTSIHATAQVYDNLLETFENLGTDVGLTRAFDGTDRLFFRGVEVISQDIWDETITDFSIANPHRLVWVQDGNLRVGTDITNPRSEGKLFFDELEEKTYFKARMDFGVNFRFADTVAYARG